MSAFVQPSKNLLSSTRWMLIPAMVPPCLWRNGVELARVSAVGGPAVHHLVPFGKLVLDGAVAIREGAGHRRRKVLRALRPWDRVNGGAARRSLGGCRSARRPDQVARQVRRAKDWFVLALPFSIALFPTVRPQSSGVGRTYSVPIGRLDRPLRARPHQDPYPDTQPAL
jgi:hypothetical protein